MHFPSNITLSHVGELMEAWSNQCTIYAAQRAEEILQALEQNLDCLIKQSDGTHEDLRPSFLVPDAVSYNYVCQAYARSAAAATASGNCGIESARRAEIILDHMLEQCRHYGTNDSVLLARGNRKKKNFNIHPPEPLVTTFNTVMNAWAKTNCGGDMAEGVFRKMEHWRHECQNKSDGNGRGSCDLYHGARPNARSLAIVLDAWANNISPSAEDEHEVFPADRALAILHHAVELRTRHIKDISRRHFGSRGEATFEKDEEGEFVGCDTSNIHLNGIAFHSVLNALARSSNGQRRAAEMAEDLFCLLQNLHEFGELDGVTNYVENFEMNDDDDDDLSVSSSLKPNTRTWSLLIQCWTNAACSDDNEDEREYAARRAEFILSTMEKLYQKGESVKPNVITYTSCIMAWSNCSSEKSSERALSLLERMEKMYEGNTSFHGDGVNNELEKPNVALYNACLSVLCRPPSSSSSRTMMQAINLLDKMEHQKIVDVTSYNTVLDGFAKRMQKHYNATRTKNEKYIEGAWSLFLRMRQEQSRCNGVSPDVITYNTIMNVMARSQRHNSIQRTQQLLDDMLKTASINPTEVSFTTVLNACAWSILDEKADPARVTFQQYIQLSKKKNSDGSGEKLLEVDIVLLASVSFFSYCLGSIHTCVY